MPISAWQVYSAIKTAVHILGESTAYSWPKPVLNGTDIAHVIVMEAIL